MPTYTEKVTVKDPTDVVQLSVESSASQSQPLQTWKDAVPTNPALSQVSKDGFVQVGDDILGFSTPDALIEAHRSDGSVNKPKRSFHALGRIGGTLTSVVQWVVQELELLGTSSINALHTALRVRVSNKNTGTPGANAELRGIDVEVTNEATAGSGAVPKATGLQVGITNASGKTISEAVGLRVKMNNAGTITNPYAIYTEGAGVSHFEDYLEVKRPAATPGTPATDFMRLYPKSDGRLYTKNWNGVEMGIGSGDVTLLYNQTLASANTFTISQTEIPDWNVYTSLELHLLARAVATTLLGGTAGGGLYLYLTLNNDTTDANYGFVGVWGGGQITSGGSFASGWLGANARYAGAIVPSISNGYSQPTTSFSWIRLLIPLYRSTNAQKYIEGIHNIPLVYGSNRVMYRSNNGIWWNNSAAITSIKLSVEATPDTFAANSNLRVFGHR